ncbi:DUF1983 domain-containing protein [Yersinia intermedia]|uniref:TipJ family phage tail tip protein n=5 Tax=Yersinia intermedia TaxID=631 RepID=UPI00223EC291|nr:DUF1983 domain-containing protein [Yersinia intermedia]UZM70048.1 DUF1983 domain-containing protein [Yersinia intermedia]
MSIPTGLTISGAKGGGDSGGGAAPRGREISSVAYMKLLIALSEGEIKGDFDGRHIYLDGTPLLNADGVENFPSVRWEYRSGTQDQSYIKGFPGAQNEIDVSTELKYGTPWVKAINNTQLSGINIRLKFPNGLYEMRGDGVKDGWRVDYAIDVSTDGGAYVETGTGGADGIANAGYEQSYRIDLPVAESGWQIRVRRLTANSTDGRHADTLQIASMTEVIDAKFRYPHTALLYIEFDARLFEGRTPTVTVLAYGRIVRVPSNYDPVNRTYTGIWDGTFKWAWTNNPAWVYYDLILNARFGLGHRLTQQQVDKWSLYQIAQYCDQQVPNGYGGMEPRFLCDLYIQGQTDGWTLLMDIASIFRGSVSWSNNMLSTIADMPGDIDPDLVFTRANILGSVNYAGSTSDTHYSTGLITYSDPNNQYQEDQEPVFVYDLVKRFGTQPLEMSAIGCTRPTEAQRRGLWAIFTNDDDNATDFKTGLEGLLPGLRPGKIFGISNAPLAGKENGGRISAVSVRTVTVDRDIDAQPGDRLIVNLPTGKSEGRTIQSVSGRKITVTTAYSVLPEPECIWVIDQENLAIEWFRVKRISDNNDNTFTINGLPYNANKYARIDTGAVIEDRPISIISPSGQSAPSNIVITSASDTAQGLAVTTMMVSWDKADGAIAYEAQWRQNSGNWINVPRSGSANFSVPGIYAGRYQVRVRAISSNDTFSIWTNSEEVRLKGKEGTPPQPIGFTTIPMVFGIALNWDFPAGADDTLKTEIHSCLSADGADPLFLTDVPYPQRAYTMQGLAAGRVFWFRARLIDRTGNQGEWTDWIRGVSETDGSILVDWIGDDIINNTEAGKNLIGRIELTETEIDSAKTRIELTETEIDDTKTHVTSIAASVIETALASDANAIQQWSNYGNNRAGIIEVRQTVADNEKSFAEYQQLIIVTFKGVEASIVDVRQTQATANEAFAKFQQQTVADLGDAYSAIEQVSTAQSTTDKALTEYKNNTNTRFENNEAGITDIRTSVSDVDKALSLLEQQTVAEFDNGAQADIENALSNDKNAQSQREESGRIRARVTTVETAQATADKSFAEYQQQVSAEFKGTNSSISDVRTAQSTTDKALATFQQQTATDLGDAHSAIEQVSTAQSTTDKALTEYKNNTNTRFDGNEADIADIRISVSSAESALSTLEQQTVAEFNNGAQADIENALSNDKNAQSQREESGRIRARVTTVETAQATADQSFAEYRQQVSAEFKNANSSISDVRTAQATADKSLSDYKQTVAADFKGVNAAVQETSSALVDFKGIVSAQWSIKLGVNKDGIYYAAGISMGLEDTPEGMQSEIVFLANNFLVMSEINGKPKAFFAIKNGQTIVDTAFIGVATIGRVHITDTLESDNYVPASTGLIIDFKTGKMEINGATPGGGRHVVNNNGSYIYNEAGVLVCEYGLLS